MAVMVPTRPGALDSVDLFQRDFAGSESNVAIALSRLGHRTAWMSRLGDDGFGRYIYRELRAEGVDVSQVTLDPRYPTGMYFKELQAESNEVGTKVYYYRSNSAASHLTIDDISLVPFQRAHYLFVTGITPALSANCLEMVMKLVARARQLGLTIVFDPNLRLKLWNLNDARPVLQAIACQADIVLSGMWEAQLLTGADSPDAATRNYLERGAKLVVIKLAADGAFYATASERGMVPAFSVHCVDQIGAGDAFDAGFISALLDGLSFPEAVKRGSALGALAVTTASDHAGLPRRHELERFLATRTGNSSQERA